MGFSADKCTIYVVTLLIPCLESIFAVNSALDIGPTQSIMISPNFIQTYFCFVVPGTGSFRKKYEKQWFLPTKTPTVLDILYRQWLAGTRARC